MLNERQQQQLLQPINPSRVKILHDGLAHLEGWDVRAHLNRIFGFCNWSANVLFVSNLYEAETTTRAGKPAYRVAYRATLELGIRDPEGKPLATYTEAAVGESTMPDFKRGDAHDMAIKTAETQALKRCCVNLGDQFGLSLYDDGSTAAVVIKTLTTPKKDEESE